MKKIFKKLYLFLIFISLFLLTDFAFGQSDWSLQLNWPDSPMGTVLDSTSGIAKLVQYFYEWGIGIGIIIFFGTLVYAGFKYITSVGDPNKVKDAKSRIVSGFSGVLLLLSSYLLLNTINPELTTIEEIGGIKTKVGFGDFQSGLNAEQNLCEFAFVTTQETSSGDSGGHDRETFFLIPGMTQTNDDFFPEKSIACKPIENEREILEVRKNDMEGYYMLVKKYSGEEVSSKEERVYYKDEDEEIDSDEYRDDLEDLYSQRYENQGHETLIINETNKEDRILPFLEKAFHKRNYNIFGATNEECENLISKEKFNRPRCLVLDQSGSQPTIKEWTKIGYPSLTETLNEIKENNENNDGYLAGASMNECPAKYEAAPSGGGCSIAFYEGETGGVPWVGWGSTPTCRQQISRPSATMDHFDGIVDRESNCMELIRHEKDLDVDLPTYTIIIENTENSGAYKSKLTLKSNGETLGSVTNEQKKEFEVDAHSLITLVGKATEARRQYLKLTTSNNECHETVNSGEVECEFSLTGNTVATFELTGTAN